MNAEISKQAKDIIQKYTSSLFANTSLEFYGIKTAKIKEMINVELPVVEVSDAAADFVFLLEDDSYLHFEFQTTYNKNDLLRFAVYDLRLFMRDSRKITTVVIYTADITKAITSVSIGSLEYNPLKVMMCEYDGDAIYKEVEAKINNGGDLEDIDMLNLIFVPLMRNSIRRDDLAVKSIELAQTIKDSKKRDTCIAAIFALANRYLNDISRKRILEVIKMTDLVDLLYEDVMKETATKALQIGLKLDDILKLTGLDIETVKQLQAELAN